MKTIKTLIYLPLILLFSIGTPNLSSAQNCCGCLEFVLFTQACLTNHNDCGTCNDALCSATFGAGYVSIFCNGNPTCAGEGCGILPVELVSFEAKYAEKQGVNITWVTASELNNDGFEVQRSSNAQIWESIEFVRGNGTTTISQAYQTHDEPEQGGLYYYRLAQVDFDGTMEYSEVIPVMVEYEAKDGIILYPNPVVDALVIRTLENQGTATIYDMTGKVIRSVQLNEIVTKIDVYDLQAGQYAVEVNLDNGQKYTKMIVK